MEPVDTSRASFLPTDEEPIRDCREDVLGIKAAAEVVGISRTQLWRFASTGKLPCTKIGTKRRPQYLFSRSDLEQFRLQREMLKAHPRRLRNGRVQCGLREAVALLAAGLIDLDQLPKRSRL